MTSNAEIVVGCLDALAAHDIDSATELLHPDIEWRNAGMPTIRGERALYAFRRMVELEIGFGVEWHHVAETADGVVLTDRHDTLSWKKLSSRFWVAGTFHLQDGQITVWDDKFSSRNLAAGTISATLRR